MRTIKFLVASMALFMFIVLATSCYYPETVKGSGNVITEKRNLSGFTAIKASNGLMVTITMGTEESVEVIADDNIVPLIVTEVKNGVLELYCKENIKHVKMRNVVIKAKSLDKIVTSSGSDVVVNNVLKANKLFIDASSGSKAALAFDGAEVVCESSSGSDIIVSGKAQKIIASSSSGSDINATDLAVEVCIASASSGADIKVNVLNEITATASSGADIKYTGNPKTINKSLSSGGSLTKK